MSAPDLILTGRYPTYDDRGRYAGHVEVLSYETRAGRSGLEFVYLCRWVGQRARREWAHVELQRALCPTRVRA